MSGTPTVDFSKLKEPSQQKYISTAGIWRGAQIKSFGIAPMKKKDPKDPNSKETGGWLEIVLENEKDGIFTSRTFPLTTNPADVKWVGKVYGSKGEELRDKTPEEQMQDDHESFAYMLIQLAMALGHPYDNVVRIVSGSPDTSFKGMIDNFTKAFIKVLPTPERIDFKTIFINSKKKQTSYLQIAQAGYRNIVFKQYNPNAGPNDQLIFTEYEKKNCLTEDYPYKKPASALANGAAAASTSANPTWTPSIQPKGNGDLF